MADDHPEQFHSELQSEPFDFHAICASKDAISFTHPDGHVEVFTPDATKGYFHFTVATAFPAGRVIYGWGLHPEVVASNYMTLLDQHLDLDHKMAVNDPKNRNAEDKIIGSIAAVNFPRPPNGASKWTILDRPQPAIQGVAVFWKNAQATQTALARHVMGRHKSTVSMDMMFGSDDSGFAVKLPSDGGGDCLFDGGESKEFLTAGYEYVSWANAPKELQYCFEDKPGTLPGTTTPRPNAIKSDYRGRQVSVIAGGLTGSIHFCGMAVVKYGAEPTAKLGKLIAGVSEESVMADLNQFPEIVRQIGAEILLKSEAPVVQPPSDAVVV